MADKETSETKTVKFEDAHGNEVEVPAGMDGENPISPNNPPEKATGSVSADVYSASGQPFEGTFGDEQDLNQAALGNPGQTDKDNSRDDREVPVGRDTRNLDSAQKKAAAKPKAEDKN